ncbi:MAG: thioesterase family protein [Firmicutes bacterium]|nr:thioesterase family protein [Bacillota bacterium]
MLEPGIKGTRQVRVREENSAEVMGSGTLKVFATPAMVALMEETAWKSVAEHLDQGEGTVGTALDIRHTAATPLGMTVTCESELTAVDGRKLTFHVIARDETGVIGEGEHQRFVVNNEKFQAKADSKGDKTKG